LDKRDLQILFRERLQSVIARSGLRQAAFARSVGLDRSALSQLLSGRSPRLPRAETLQRIAETHAISLDWLMGLSQSDRLVTEVAQTLEIEESKDGSGDTRLAEWHREAIGYKIRYVPANIPDLLRTEEVIEYEYSAGRGARAETQIREAGRRLDYSRRPETDMEVCMPVQRLRAFAAGSDVWTGLSGSARARQLTHMADLLVELYPTFRLFLYDGLTAFSAPYTLFGPLRAALYMGDQYLVINTAEHIRALTNHFDNLIRRAIVNPSECAEFVRTLLREK
jgi:transcriptional regulator with XRE-family HTH domain